MAKIEFDHCKQCDCGKKQLIVNRTHWLCDKKNKERLDAQKSPTHKIDKSRQIIQKSRVHVNQISTKQKERNIQIKNTYQFIAESRPHLCSGCGRSNRLSHSHIIPRSKRKDLEADPNNIVYDCLSFGEEKGCHDIWEHGSTMEKRKLLNYEQRMQYIKEVDSQYYNLLISKQR